jgi:hypothetical protein
VICHADERLSTTPGAPTRSDRLTEGGSHHGHPPNLLALPSPHENRVEALSLDHCIGECINRLGWFAGDPLLIVLWQAVAKLHAQIGQQLGRVHDENGNSRIALS